MPSSCTAPACDRAAVARGLCATHYGRHRRGRPLDPPILSPGDGEQLAIRCRRPLLERLRARASASGLTLSQAVRAAIEAWLR